jgi:hypothetical protein
MSLGESCIFKSIFMSVFEYDRQGSNRATIYGMLNTFQMTLSLAIVLHDIMSSNQPVLNDKASRE